MPAALSAPVRKSAAQATLTLPFRVPPQEWFTLKQAGAVMGLAESTVEKLYDRGEFTGHRHNAGDGHRQHKRILRASLVTYMVRSADYTDESFGDALVACFPYLPSDTLLRLRNEISRHLAGDGASRTTGLLPCPQDSGKR